MNYREAHPKFSGRVHQHHSLRRNLRRKVRRDDALRTFEIVLRSVKRGREGRSWIQGGTNNRCLLRSFWTRKGKEGEEEGSDVGQGVRSEEEFSECPSSSCSFSAASSSSNYVSDLIPLLTPPVANLISQKWGGGLITFWWIFQ